MLKGQILSKWSNWQLLISLILKLSQIVQEVSQKSPRARLIRCNVCPFLPSILNHSAYLSCESGEMIVKINFTEPFRGQAYADYDRSSPCKFYGDGSRYYEMRIPLKGCGSRQVSFVSAWPFFDPFFRNLMPLIGCTFIGGTKIIYQQYNHPLSSISWIGRGWN